MQALRAFFLQAFRQVCGGLLAATVTLAFLQVVLRYGFAASIVWVEEISVLLLLLLCWLGAAQLWLARAHVLVDLVARHGTARRRVDRLIDVLGLSAGAGLAVFTVGTLQSFSGIEMGSLEIDASLRYYPILAGGTGIACAALLNLIAPPAEGDDAAGNPGADSGSGGGPDR